MNSGSTPRGPSSTSTRGSSSPFRARGRGRGRGSPFFSPQNASNQGSAQRGASTSTPRGTRGRGTRGGNRGTPGTPSTSNSQRFHSPSATSTFRMPVLPTRVAPDAIKPHNPDKIMARREKLKEQYNELREKAIADGRMSSEDQSSIDEAIRTRGVCTQMCDEKERVERIFNGSVAPEETLPHPDTGHLVAIEGRMVKAFRRSAAGTDRQIPEELRTAKTCWKTLNYLFSEIIGSDDRLGKHHKFVWDRTRAIRNDFTIQGFTKPEDVKYEVACHEGIIRFHILSLHQLSNPSQINSNEEYSRQQEIAQLKATFTSLLDRYDTFSGIVNFRNEAEFRAYFALFSARTDLFDTDVAIQTWPKHVLDDGRVQTALKLHAAAATTDVPVGSYKLQSATPLVAQNNAGLYWKLLSSRQVGYLMACAAEISFQIVRFTALNALWRSAKAASKPAQNSMRSWTKEALTEYLGFDNDEQTVEFCKSCDVDFAQHGAAIYLDFTSNPNSSLDQPRFDPTDPKCQIFSESIVEQKRCGRSYTAVLKGLSIAQAQQAGLVSEYFEPPKAAAKNNSMFVGDDDDDVEADNVANEPPVVLNPTATSFFPTGASAEQLSWMNGFTATGSKSSDGFSSGVSGQKFEEKPPAAATGPASPFSSLNKPPPESQSGFSFSTKSTGPPSPFSTLNQAQPQQTGKDTTTKPSTTEPLFSWLKKSDEPFTSSSAKSATATTEPSSSPFNFPSTGRDEISSILGQKPAISRERPIISGGKVIDTNTPADTWDSDPNRFSFLDKTKWNTGNSSSAPITSGVIPAPVEAAKPAQTANSTATPLTTQPPFKPASFDFSTSKSEASQKGIGSKPAFQSTTADGSRPPSTNGFFNKPVSTSASASTVQPLPSLQKPSLPTFASLSQEKQSTTPVGSPARPTFGFTQPSLSQPSPVKTPVTTQPTQSPTPQRPVIDEEELLHQLCRIGLVQRDGVLDMFINLRVSQIVQDVFRRFQYQNLQKETDALKEKVLQRKFFALWVSAAAQRRLRRKADRRRNKLAASIRAEQERKRVKATDMAQILEAEREKRTIQEEIRQKQEKELERRKGKETMKDQPFIKPPQPQPTQQAGQKRKTLTHSTSRSNIQDISMSPMHKRSKTLGKESTTLRALSPSPLTATSTGYTDLRRSVSQRSLQQSVTSQRLDQTKTDYFRLKAAGLDPETPLIPHTAASLASKKQRETEHYNQRLEEISRRPSSRPAHSQSSRTSSPAVQLEKVASPVPIPPLAKALIPPANLEEDPFLKSLQEARHLLHTDTDWFKIKSGEIEKEVSVVEEFRRSRDSAVSQTDSNPLATSVSGFARSTSGVDYVPPALQPGQTLSRTEERIRRTGARGLASKPIGGTPGHSPLPDYSAVAMSKRSANTLLRAASTDSLPTTNRDALDHGKKRDFDDIVGTDSLAHNSTAVHYAVTQPDVPVQVTKKAKNADASTHVDLARLQEFVGIAADHAEYDDEEDYEENGEYEDEEEEDEEDDEDVEGNFDRPQHRAQPNGIVNGQLYQNEEDFYDEEEDYEDEDDAEDEEEPNESDDEPVNLPEAVPFHGRSYYSQHVPRAAYSHEEEVDEDEIDDRSRSVSHLSAPRHESRAESAATDTGVGSTVDDAIELSD